MRDDITYIKYCGEKISTERKHRFVLPSTNELVVFTTLVVRKLEQHNNAMGVFWPHHFRRIYRSAIELFGSSPVSEPQLSEQASTHYRHFINTHSVTTACVRLRVLVSKTWHAFAFDIYQAPWSPGAGVSACSFIGERRLAQHKTNFAEVSLQARQHAQSLGFNEAILIDTNSVAREGAWSNLFWFDQKGVLYTTENNILPGVVRAVIIRHHPVVLADWTLERLLAEASEVFLTLSTIGLVPVTRLDSKNFMLDAMQFIPMLLREYRNWEIAESTELTIV